MTDTDTDSETETEPESDSDSESATVPADYVAENSDATQPPSQLRDDDGSGAARQADGDWACDKCGASLRDAMDLATHDCPPAED